MTDFASTGTFSVEEALTDLGAERRLRGLELLALEGGHSKATKNGIDVYVKHNKCWACDTEFPAHSPEFSYFIETREPWQIEAVTRAAAVKVLSDPL